MTLSSSLSSVVFFTIASATAGLWPFFSALARTSALMAEDALASIVPPISCAPPVGEAMMGAAAPMTLCGAM